MTFEFVPDSTIGWTGDGIGEGEAAAARLGGAPEASGAAPLPPHAAIVIAMARTTHRLKVGRVYICDGAGWFDPYADPYRGAFMCLLVRVGARFTYSKRLF